MRLPLLLLSMPTTPSVSRPDLARDLLTHLMLRPYACIRLRRGRGARGPVPNIRLPLVEVRLALLTPATPAHAVRHVRSPFCRGVERIDCRQS